VLSFEQMKELLELVSKKGLGGVELREGDSHFRVAGKGQSLTTPVPAPSLPAVSAGATAAVAVVEVAEPDESLEGYTLTSPIVGTFYVSPSPEAEPYVHPGDRVEKGQVLCIVEAMKLMNEIESDVSGVVLSVIPQNAQPVEFGEPLFSIKTD